MAEPATLSGRSSMPVEAFNMVSLRTILARLHRAPVTRTTCLSAREAAALAEAAASRAGFPRTYGHAVLVDGVLVWGVAQVSIGSGWVVHVDDATGETRPITRWGLR